MEKRLDLDQIMIKNLEVFAHHGVYPEEMRLGQKFMVSCVLYLDTRRAGKTDELAQSVDYGRVSHFISEWMSANTYRLLEAAAEHLAEELLLLDEKVCQADLEIQKPWAPIGLSLDTVSVKIQRRWHEVFVSVGSNMGQRQVYIQDALKALGETKGCRIRKVSALVETEPYGGVEQDLFLNGVWKLETLLTPHELLDRLHELEQEAGRERKIHWGPRTLDLDIVFYDDLVLEEDGLCIPHVDMQNREFVLKPMAEIAPYKRHPVYGWTVKEMLERISGHR